MSEVSGPATVIKRVSQTSTPMRLKVNKGKRVTITNPMCRFWGCRTTHPGGVTPAPPAHALRPVSSAVNASRQRASRKVARLGRTRPFP